MAVRVDPAELERLAAHLFDSAGVPPEAARAAAGVLVRTDCRGIESHGVRHLPGRLKQLRSGGADANAVASVEQETSVSAIVDGHGGLGLTAALKATDLAIAKARQANVAVVVVRNGNHLGAAGHYALLCAEAGLIALVTTNASPVMTVTGSQGRVLGNDPIAYGITAGQAPPIVHDIALSAVAGGKITMAAERGQQVPLGWIVDKLGRPTQHPADYISGGALMPLGEHKGYGLAVLVEVLTGALSGAGMGSEVKSWVRHADQPTNTGHSVIAINPAAFGPIERFHERIAALCEEIRSAPRAPGVERIYLPGEIEHEHEQAARRHGLVLNDLIWSELVKTAVDSGREASIPTVEHLEGAPAGETRQ